MADFVSKWAAGTHYGPVLSQTDLYLLNAPLEINPILQGTHASFHLVFNLQTGQTGGFNPDARDRDLAFTQKDEPATLPRVSQLVIITNLSPWCTVVTNERGVTMADVCTAVWKDYTEFAITDTEFQVLPPRLQEQVRRVATMSQQQQSWGAMFYTPSTPANRFKRVDWLRERIYFERLQLNDDYAKQKLGFRAPNVFTMELTA